ELERVFLQMAARGPKGSRPELVYARAGVRIGRWESAHDRLPPTPRKHSALVSGVRRPDAVSSSVGEHSTGAPADTP
ncbi:hypothetical protein, partial [Hydrogenibacillus schlegelii]|uniref:hypothetical protein n=1 Tax=Hydrogenibacillus schlegelii TaxID=1484 RepID=UPI0034A07DDD